MNGRDIKLGSLLPNTWQSRDAIHTAVVPIEASESLSPGQHVGIVDGRASSKAESIGVVDPFLRITVNKGECFWLMLYPGTITTMRHEWSHPAFPSNLTATSEEKAVSEAWLSGFIGTWFDNDNYEIRVPMYKKVIDDILRGERGTLYGREERKVPSEFWFHLERLIGRQIDHDIRESTVFECQC